MKMGKLTRYKKRYRVVAISYFQLLAEFTGTAAELIDMDVSPGIFQAFMAWILFLHFPGGRVAQSPFPLANSCVTVDDPTLELHLSSLMNGPL